MKKFIAIIIAIFVIAFVGIFGYGIFIRCNHRMKPKAATEQINIHTTYAELPEDWQKQVSDLFKVRHTLEFCRMSGKIHGETNLLTHKVKINERASDVEKVIAYAHELTHLKYYTVNETFTEYKATIILYESGVPYFRNAALINVNCIVNCGGYTNTEYDCGAYLLEYFRFI